MKKYLLPRLVILSFTLSLMACEQPVMMAVNEASFTAEKTAGTAMDPEKQSFKPTLNVQTSGNNECAEEVIVELTSGQTQHSVTPNLPCLEPIVDSQLDLSGDYIVEFDGSLPDIPHWRENLPDPGFVRGERLAYTSLVNGQEDVFISHVDGSNFIKITSSSDHERFPTFSSNGHFISYATNRLQRGWELFESFSLGRYDSRITFDYLNAQPIEWSSQNELTFTNNGKLYIYSVEQNQIRSLIPHQQVQSPVWSSDGETIAYTYQGDIYSVSRMGENNQILVKGPQVTGSIDWSNDDQTIVFESQGRILKHKVDADFAVLQATPKLLGAFVILSEQGDMDPVFSPDGSEVAFTSTRTGQKEIFVVDSQSGANVRQITHHDGESYHPAW